MENKIPVLRFPEFKNNYKLYRLSEFLTERIEFPAEILPLYSLTIEFGVIPKSERYERAFLVKNESEAYKVMHEDDFAYNPMNLRFGALAMYTGVEKIVVSKYYNIFYCNKKIDTKFIELFLTSYRRIKYYNSMATGSLEEKKRVHYSDFKKFQFLFPPLPEQQKIAAFHTAIDDNIQQLTSKIQLLEQYKKGCMQQIFSQAIRFKDDNGKNYPDWEEKKLGDVLTFFSTNSHSRSLLNYDFGQVKKFTLWRHTYKV